MVHIFSLARLPSLTSVSYRSRMPTDHVGIIIARARQARRLTQVQLAEALEVSPSTVADWERGASYPLRKAGLVEQFLGITIPPRDEIPAAS
jgi:ribosome-binding protein aMBF1 (putative translation factor)